MDELLLVFFIRMVIDQENTKLLGQPEREPPQVFDFNLGALDKILGPMLYQNDPAESGNHEAS
jgi:hypothetical protein